MKTKATIFLFWFICIIETPTLTKSKRKHKRQNKQQVETAVETITTQTRQSTPKNEVHRIPTIYRPDIIKDVQPLTDHLNHFLKPLDFTPEAIENFIKYTFNHPRYAAEFLPHNFTHIKQFLVNGKEKQLPRIYTKSVCKLFSKKIKETPYTNAYAFSAIIQDIPDLCDYHFSPQTRSSLEGVTEKVKDLLYSSFLNKFSYFQDKPDEFLDELSEHIASETKKNDEEDVSDDQLRYSIIHLLENGLNKIIWSAEDQHEIWPSIKKLDEDLSTLAERQIIGEDDDLDDLYWSLANRFCYFIEQMSEHLDLSFYTPIKKDIEESNLVMFQLEEQEDNMESKAQRMARAIVEAEAKYQAQKMGLL